MRRAILVGVVALLMAPMVGCGLDWNSIETGHTGNYENTSDTNYVVKDDVAWNFLYRWTKASTFGQVQIPNVDFNGNVVLAAFLSERTSGGFGISFDDVEWTANQPHATVTLHETVPSGPAAAVITKPYAFARLAAQSTDEYTFKKDGQTVSHTTVTYVDLLMEDLVGRIPFTVPANPGHVADLEQGICPIDGTPLSDDGFPSATIMLGTSLKEAPYCTTHGEYWGKVTYLGTIPGPTTTWYGPFAPGK